MPGGREIKAGQAFVEITLRGGRQLQRDLERMQRRVQSFANSAMAAGKALVGLGVAAGTGFAFAVKAASDMQETMGKFDVVFGENAKAMKAWGDTFAGQVGRSRLQVAGFLASAKDLFSPLGFDESAAVEMSKTITQLAVDLGSFNNIADADVMRDLQAALTGSGETMKKYGVVVNEAGVKQELLNMALDPKIATEAQKAQARLNIILRGTTAAQGDALRTAGSFANQMKSLQATFSDMAVEIGSALLPTLTSMIQYVTPIVKQVAAWAASNPQLIVTLAGVTAGVIGLGVALVATGVVASATASVFGVLAGVVGFLISPVGLLVAGIGAATAALLYFSGGGMAALQAMEGTFTSLKDVAIGTFRAIFDALSAGDFEMAGNIAMVGLNAAFQRGLAGITRGVEAAINSIIGFISRNQLIADILTFGGIRVNQMALNMASTTLQGIAARAETKAGALAAELASLQATAATRADEARNLADIGTGGAQVPATGIPGMPAAPVMPTIPQMEELTTAIEQVAQAVTPETIIQGTAAAAQRAYEIGRNTAERALSEAVSQTGRLVEIRDLLKQGGTVAIMEGVS